MVPKTNAKTHVSIYRIPLGTTMIILWNRTTKLIRAIHKPEKMPAGSSRSMYFFDNSDNIIISAMIIKVIRIYVYSFSLSYAM